MNFFSPGRGIWMIGPIQVDITFGMHGRLNKQATPGGGLLEYVRLQWNRPDVGCGERMRNRRTTARSRSGRARR